MRSDERIVMVTGAARGIGKAIAVRFAAEGAHVAVCDVNAELAEATAEEIRGTGRKAIAISLDVRDTGQVDAALQKVVSEFGRLDVLVNNAGITIAKPVVDFDDEEWDRTVEINLKGVFRCARAAARQMISQKGGKIINIASESGKTGKPFFAIYSATKFGVVGFTQALAQELAKFGINVNAVCPGIVHTDMWTELDETLARLQGLKPGESLEARKKNIPLGRLETPEDVAGVVAFLASDDAAYMTGQAVNVTGGREFH